ncbi:hypothetical protein CR152_01290 [Massilia violaceinigra]|uniref:Zeta toxin domain-containing protein n=1 Tax=Massilia violaceinigra TaxID=2045208 RepID=A0A2D2DE73_9BURK|nr:zeta toxin family protein [Massilia violaceinigra]ATQ73290.1 hypothetical protein CR152_01290 [Massilia violaceinigra]
MTDSYARPLRDHESIEAFLGSCLGIRHAITLNGGGSLDLPELCKRIRDAESAVAVAYADPTISSRRNRVQQYRSENTRAALHDQILTELISYDRLDSDENICLGSGGSKPRGRDAQAGARAYLVTGLPGAGKSTVVSAIADRLGAMVLDSDFAKRKLPEFGHALAGAALVHKESSMIIFGKSFAEPRSLSEYCVLKKLNVVIPVIGNDERRLKTMRNSFINHGYQVHLTALLLDRVDATKRALVRFLETGRYVPLSMIFDTYANDPALTYYKAWMDIDTGTDAQWASLGALMAASRPVNVHSYSSDANPAVIWEPAS